MIQSATGTTSTGTGVLQILVTYFREESIFLSLYTLEKLTTYNTIIFSEQVVSLLVIYKLLLQLIWILRNFQRIFFFFKQITLGCFHKQKHVITGNLNDCATITTDYAEPFQKILTVYRKYSATAKQLCTGLLRTGTE